MTDSRQDAGSGEVHSYQGSDKKKGQEFITNLDKFNFISLWVGHGINSEIK